MDVTNSFEPGPARESTQVPWGGLELKEIVLLFLVQKYVTWWSLFPEQKNL